jgi:nucleoside-diphosphate-sugar epimerase
MVDVCASPWSGVANIGGGSRVSMNEVLKIVDGLCGPVRVRRMPTAVGDVRHTAADCTVARTSFQYCPATSLADGLAEMVAATSSRRAAMA